MIDDENFDLSPGIYDHLFNGGSPFVPPTLDTAPTRSAYHPDRTGADVQMAPGMYANDAFLAPENRGSRDIHAEAQANFARQQAVAQAAANHIAEEQAMRNPTVWQPQRMGSEEMYSQIPINALRPAHALDQQRLLEQQRHNDMVNELGNKALGVRAGHYGDLADIRRDSNDIARQNADTRTKLAEDKADKEGNPYFSEKYARAHPLPSGMSWVPGRELPDGTSLWTKQKLSEEIGAEPYDPFGTGVGLDDATGIKEGKTATKGGKKYVAKGGKWHPL